MEIVRLQNTQPHNVFIDSIAKNIAPGCLITLLDSVVKSDPHIAKCIATGVLKIIEEPKPTKVDQSKVETETKTKPVLKPVPEPQAESEPGGDAVVAIGGDKTAVVKPRTTAEMPLPEWLDKDQLRRSEAAARAYDASEGLVEELRVTDEGIEMTRGGQTELVSEDGVTIRKTSDPADAMPEPVKVDKIRRTDDGTNDPMVPDENNVEDYSTAFVDETGKKPKAGYGEAFIGP